MMDDARSTARAQSLKRQICRLRAGAGFPCSNLTPVRWPAHHAHVALNSAAGIGVPNTGAKAMAPTPIKRTDSTLVDLVLAGRIKTRHAGTMLRLPS